jgi:hypothetical protein
MIADSDSDLLVSALVSCSVYLRLCAMDFARIASTSTLLTLWIPTAQCA